MIAEHFRKIKEEIGQLDWLIDKSGIESEFDEDPGMCPFKLNI